MRVKVVGIALGEQVHLRAEHAHRRIVGMLVQSPESVMTSSFLLLFPLTMASNIFVDPRTMPPLLQAIVAYNPVSHLANASRGLMHGGFPAGEVAWVLGASVVVTAVFGLAFIGIELYEFAHLIHIGATPQRSAFLSSFFTLVGTHGLHVTFGIVWLATLWFQVRRFGLIEANKRRLMCLSLFWHFLDVIWIGVFTVVYLMGVLR